MTGYLLVLVVLDCPFSSTTHRWRPLLGGWRNQPLPVCSDVSLGKRLPALSLHLAVVKSSHKVPRLVFNVFHSLWKFLCIYSLASVKCISICKIYENQVTIYFLILGDKWACTHGTHSTTSLYKIYNNSIFLVRDDVIKWKHLLCYWPFVRGNHRSPVDLPHKGQ